LIVALGSRLRTALLIATGLFYLLIAVRALG